MSAQVPILGKNKRIILLKFQHLSTTLSASTHLSPSQLRKPVPSREVTPPFLLVLNIISSKSPQTLESIRHLLNSNWIIFAHIKRCSAMSSKKKKRQKNPSVTLSRDCPISLLPIEVELLDEAVPSRIHFSTHSHLVLLGLLGPLPPRCYEVSISGCQIQDRPSASLTSTPSGSTADSSWKHYLPLASVIHPLYFPPTLQELFSATFTGFSMTCKAQS